MSRPERKPKMILYELLKQDTRTETRKLEIKYAA